MTNEELAIELDEIMKNHHIKKKDVYEKSGERCGALNNMEHRAAISLKTLFCILNMADMKLVFNDDGRLTNCSSENDVLSFIDDFRNSLGLSVWKFTRAIKYADQQYPKLMKKTISAKSHHILMLINNFPQLSMSFVSNRESCVAEAAEESLYTLDDLGKTLKMLRLESGVKVQDINTTLLSPGSNLKVRCGRIEGGAQSYDLEELFMYLACIDHKMVINGEDCYNLRDIDKVLPDMNDSDIEALLDEINSHGFSLDFKHIE